MDSSLHYVKSFPFKTWIYQLLYASLVSYVQSSLVQSGLIQKYRFATDGISVMLPVFLLPCHGERTLFIHLLVYKFTGQIRAMFFVDLLIPIFLYIQEVLLHQMPIKVMLHSDVTWRQLHKILL